MTVLNKMKKILPWLILILFSGTILFVSAVFLIPPKVIDIIPEPAKISEDNSDQKAETETPERISLILVGDIMLGRGVEYMVKKHGQEDFRFPFLKIADYLNEFDIVFGNLEGMISDKGSKVGSIYSFRVKPEAIEGLKFAGFNVLSLANNHALDYTKLALEDCLERLSNEEIKYVGAGFSENEAYSLVIKETKKVKIGFLAYTDLGPEVWRARKENSGIAWISKNDFERIEKDIKNAKSQADILIVSLHSGEEYVQKLTEFQTEFSKMAIDAGADIIAGHHPHVIQLNEIYNSGHIFYSLGNFIFDQSFSEETMTGQIIEILIEDKKIKEVIPLNIKINQYYQPTI